HKGHAGNEGNVCAEWRDGQPRLFECRYLFDARVAGGVYTLRKVSPIPQYLCRQNNDDYVCAIWKHCKSNSHPPSADNDRQLCIYRSSSRIKERTEVSSP